MGVIGGGSSPLALVGFVALLTLLRYISHKLILSVNDNSKKKGNSMKKTKIAGTRIVASCLTETLWAMGVSNVVGHLST
jgi:hypothetical protein